MDTGYTLLNVAKCKLHNINVKMVLSLS